MQHLTIFLIIVLFSFSGCSNKTTPELSDRQVNTPITDTTPSVDAQYSKQEADNNDQEFQDEFEAEFEAEETEKTNDLLAGYNRSMTTFNDKMITYALIPVSEAYAAVIPQPLRVGLSNFIQNLNFPIRFANNLLQGKLQNVSDETERFIVNSTIGLAGFMDPAQTYMNIPAHKEDFGQTLGHYGLGPGFHIVLPFLGPSNLRDLAGITLDAYLSPLVNIRGDIGNLANYKIPKNLGQSIGIYAVETINKTSLHLGEYEDLKKDAIDLYPFLRDIYEQKRNSDIAE